MGRLPALITAATITLTLVNGSGATAEPSQGGFATDNVTYVGFLPFEVGTATGANIQGKYMYVTGWKSFSIYDISDPLAPVLLTEPPVPVGFQFENENVSVSPDGKLMLFSESLPNNILHVWDVSQKNAPVEIAQAEGAGDHTSTCVLGCKWVYGSDGHITDMRDPSKPKLLKKNWHVMTGLQGGAHDVTEYRDGFLVTAPISAPAQILDVRRPAKPKVLARAEHPNPAAFLFHSGRFPNGGRDRFLLMQGEQNFNPRCTEDQGPFMTFDARGWRKSGSFKLLDTYTLPNGVYADGAPAANALGCSAHWFTEHPDFQDGGLVALAYYEHGTRFVMVGAKGKISEAGWFVPFAGSTSAAYWVTKDLVYSVDYTRGVDILQFHEAHIQH